MASINAKLMEKLKYIPPSLNVKQWSVRNAKEQLEIMHGRQRNWRNSGYCVFEPVRNVSYVTAASKNNIQCVPLATKPGISLIILPLMRILQRSLKRPTGTFLFISHTTNLRLFKFRCNIFIGVRVIKEMPGSVASGTRCIWIRLEEGSSKVFKQRPPWPHLHYPATPIDINN